MHSRQHENRDKPTAAHGKQYSKFESLRGQWLILALGCCNGPDQDTEHCLGHNVGDGVADLFCAGCSRTGDAHHLDDVDTWVCEPGDNSQVACLDDESLGGDWLLVGCSDRPTTRVNTAKQKGLMAMPHQIQ